MGVSIPRKNAYLQADITAGIKVVAVDSLIVSPTNSMQFLSSLTSALKSNKVTPPSLAVTNGLVAHANLALTGVTGAYDRLVYVVDTGVDATSPIVYWGTVGRTSNPNVIGGNIFRL